MSTGFKGPLVHGPISNQAAYAYRAKMGMMNSAEFAIFHDDFQQFVTGNVPTGWEADIIDTGATITTLATAAVGANGAIAIADATASEGAAVYTPKSFQLTSGKKCFIEARVRTSDVTDNAVQFGLSDLTATTNPEDLYTTTAANLVTLGILDGDATVQMLSDAGNSGSTAELGSIDIAVDTWYTLAIYYDGLNLHGYVNGKKALSWSQASTTIPTGVALALFVAAVNGNGAGANTNYFDYIRVVQER